MPAGSGLQHVLASLLTMVPPPCLSIWIISYFIHNHTPFRLMLRTRSQVSSVHSWRGARGRDPMPALLWAQSKPTVSLGVTSAVVGTYGYDDGRIWRT